jgi:hypothetical protein
LPKVYLFCTGKGRYTVHWRHTAFFSGIGGQGDFRLSGFEWSFRIASPINAASRVGRRSKFHAPELDLPTGEYSTATDWYDFGLLAAELFGVSLDALKKRDAICELIQKHSYLRTSERTVLLQLLADKSDERLATGREVVQTIGNIVQDLSAVTGGAGRSLILGVRLGRDQDVSRAIYTASRGAIGLDDAPAQKKFVEDDLRGDIRVTARTAQRPYLISPWCARRPPQCG